MPQTHYKMPKNHKKTALGLLFLALFISFFYSINLPLFDVDEGAFSEASREMLVSRNFISPKLDRAPRYDKPIFIYWLQAASMHLFGINETAARLPAALASCLWAGIIFLFLRYLGYESIGFFAAIIMASSLELSIIGKAATADTLLNLWLSATMFLFFLYFTRHSRFFLLLAFASMGLGFLTKGPVAILIPVAVTLLFSLISPHHCFKHWLRSFFNPAGILIFLAIVLPWYAAEFMRDGFDFIQGFFLKHNLGRFSQAMETHDGGWWYYLPIIIVGLFPYSAFLLPITRKWHSISDKPLHLFLWLWFLFVLILFSLSSTKLPHYIVYGLTPLFILIAMEWGELKNTTTPTLQLQFWAFIPALLIFSTLALLPIILNAINSNLTNPTAQDTYGTLNLVFSDPFFLSIQILFILLLISCFIFRPLRHVYSLLLLGLFMSWDINHYVLPAVAVVQQQPIKEAALLAKENQWNVHHWRIKAPSFSFYRQKPSLHTPPSKNEIVLTKQAHLADFKDYTTLYLNHGIALIRIQ